MKSKQNKDLTSQESLIIDLATKWCIKALDDVNLHVKRVSYDENDKSSTDGWHSTWDTGATRAVEELEKEWGIVIDLNADIDFSSLWLTFDAKLVTEEGDIHITLNCCNPSGDFYLSVDGSTLRDGYLGVDI
jgi:hypothetical protein